MITQLQLQLQLRLETEQLKQKEVDAKCLRQELKEVLPPPEHEGARALTRSAVITPFYRKGKGGSVAARGALPIICQKWAEGPFFGENSPATPFPLALASVVCFPVLA